MKKDTKHEILLRRSLWRLGLRYRKHVAALPGNPDLVFPGDRVIVFCNGDFWHGRDWEVLQSEFQQQHNASYWLAKIAGNRERDQNNNALLSESGWLVIRLWETDIRKDPDAVACAVRDAVATRNPTRPHQPFRYETPVPDLTQQPRPFPTFRSPTCRESTTSNRPWSAVWQIYGAGDNR